MKSLILIALLFSTIAQAQNLSTYDRVFPKQADPSFGHLVFGMAEAFTGLYAMASLTEETDEFWKKMFPNEHTQLAYSKAELRKLEEIVEKGKVTEEITQSIRQYKAEINQTRHDLEILKFTKLKEIGIEGDYARQAFKRIRVYGLIARGVGIYLVVDGVTRFAVALSKRDPGLMAGVKLAPIAVSELKTLVST